jgi:hypothetical protein
MSSLGFVLLGALAVIVGALIPVQAATNAAMSRVIGSVAITVRRDRPTTHDGSCDWRRVDDHRSHSRQTLARVSDGP